MKSYSSEELKAMKSQSLSDWNKVDATTDDDLERLLAGDDDES